MSLIRGMCAFSHCPPLGSFSSPFRFTEMKVQTTGPAGLAPGVDVGFGRGGPRRPPGLVRGQEMAFSCPRGRLRSSQVGGGRPGVGVSVRPWSVRDPQTEGWRRLAGPEMSRELPRDSQGWGALKWSLRPASKLPGASRGGGVSAWTDGDGEVSAARPQLSKQDEVPVLHVEPTWARTPFASRGAQPHVRLRADPGLDPVFHSALRCTAPGSSDGNRINLRPRGPEGLAPDHAALSHSVRFSSDQRGLEPVTLP